LSETEKVLEILSDIGNALESLGVNIKHQIGTLIKVSVKEETFLALAFEEQPGNKIGAYAVAYEKNNIPDKFQQAYNILKQNNATINHRYHGDAYTYSYWLYGEGKIYRQKLKPK